MQNKKSKIKILIEKCSITSEFNVIMKVNGSSHNIGNRNTEYSANNLAVSIANMIKPQYIEFCYYEPEKIEANLFDINIENSPASPVQN